MIGNRRRPLDGRSPRWWAVSVVVHVALIAALAQIVFKYPLG